MNQIVTTDIKTKKVVKVDNGNGNKGRRQRGQAPPAAPQPAPGNGKSRNARRRRANKKVTNQINGTSQLQKSTLINTMMKELDIEKSIGQMLQTQTNPTLGVFRPYSAGTDMSAILGFRSSAVSPALTSTNNILSFMFVPSWATTVGSQNVLCIGANSTIGNPYLATAPVQIAGPFTTAAGYQSAYRYIGAEIQITPISSQSNQAGAGKVAYFPNTPALSGPLIEQAAIGLPLQGSDQIICHPMPCQAERIYGSDAISGGFTSMSSIYGYIYVPSGLAASCSWRFDIVVFYEFLPNLNYLPLTVRELPAMHPDAAYYVNKIVNAEGGRPLILSTMESWMAAVGLHPKHLDGHTNAFQMNYNMGLYNMDGNAIAQAAEGMQTVEEIEENVVEAEGDDGRQMGGLLEMGQQLVSDAVIDSVPYARPALNLLNAGYQLLPQASPTKFRK